MVGRVAVLEKPKILWDHAELERFHARIVIFIVAEIMLTLYEMFIR